MPTCQSQKQAGHKRFSTVSDWRMPQNARLLNRSVHLHCLQQPPSSPQAPLYFLHPSTYNHLDDLTGLSPRLSRPSLCLCDLPNPLSVDELLRRLLTTQPLQNEPRYAPSPINQAVLLRNVGGLAMQTKRRALTRKTRLLAHNCLPLPLQWLRKLPLWGSAYNPSAQRKGFSLMRRLLVPTRMRALLAHHRRRS